MTDAEDRRQIELEGAYAIACEQAKEMARTLNKEIFVVAVCPDRAFGALNKRYAFLLEPDPWYGGTAFTPDGQQLECEEYT